MNYPPPLRQSLLIASLALCACVTTPSKVIEIGPDTYSLNVTGIGFETQGGTNIKALSTASDFCASLHRHLLVQQNAENGVYGFSPRQSTLTFRCTDTPS